MATVTTPTIEPTATAAADQRVWLRGIGWDGYETLLGLKGDRCSPRLVYLDGQVSLLEGCCFHEFLRERVRSFVSEVLMGLNIEYNGAGATTFCLEEKGGGVEADLSYYLANHQSVSLMRGLDLRNDPPPDLVVEVIVDHDAADALEVYRRLEVPEVWICTPQRVAFLGRGDDGHYRKIDTSLSVGSLAPADLLPWLIREGDAGHLGWTLALRRWVAEFLLPRHRGPGKEGA